MTKLLVLQNDDNILNDTLPVPELPQTPSADSYRKKRRRGRKGKRGGRRPKY
jgi:hypothetical protein